MKKKKKKHQLKVLNQLKYWNFIVQFVKYRLFAENGYDDISLLQVSEWKSIPFQSIYLWFIPIDYEWMRNLIPTHGLIRSESPNDSVRLQFILFQSANWCHKFIPNDSAPIRSQFSFRLNPFNSVKLFRMIPCHFPFNLNDSVPLRAQSEWFRRAFTRTGFRMIRKQISHLHGITRNRFHSEWVRKLHSIYEFFRFF